MSKAIIGIDQSYTRTGVTVLKDRDILYMFEMDFKGCKTNSDKRKDLREVVETLLKDERINNADTDVEIIMERIRLKSQEGGDQSFISESYIKATGALIATVIDVAHNFEVPVYSVDTRSWKSAIVGTSKPKENKFEIDPKKYPTILYIKEKGLLEYVIEPYKGRGTKGIITVKKDGVEHRCRVMDDVADSYCIALYGYLPKSKKKLQEEKF